jgi:methylated-DNA-[protein]-cysteine S-methyltransferase
MDHYYLFNTAWGSAGVVLGGKSGELIRSLELPMSDRARVKSQILRKWPDAEPGPDPPKALAKKVIHAVQDYFEGKRVDIDFPVDSSCFSSFQKRVYRELRKVRYSEVRTYSWLAEKIGSPRATRAVGLANARNPVPLIIPCHRIIRRDGGLGGFSGPGGIKLKRKMLKLEAEVAGTRNSPFLL